MDSYCHNIALAIRFPVSMEWHHFSPLFFLILNFYALLIFLLQILLYLFPSYFYATAMANTRLTLCLNYCSSLLTSFLMPNSSLSSSLTTCCQKNLPKAQLWTYHSSKANTLKDSQLHMTLNSDFWSWFNLLTHSMNIYC